MSLPPGQLRPIPATPEAVSMLPVTDMDRLIFDGYEPPTSTAPTDPALQEDVTITLTISQWAVVLATLRSAAGFASKPGVIRLAHEKMYPQLRAQVDTALARHRDGNPEGEK